MAYLDPLVLAKIGNLKIRARYIVEGFLSGIHRSKYFGYSQEFAHHRGYSYGDELRFLDWKIYGRLDKLFVKQYQSESSLKAYILLDISGSMIFSSNGITKLEYAKSLAATLAYLLIKQQDYVGLITFDNKITNIIPPRSYVEHISTIIETLSSITHGEDTKISIVINKFGSFIKRRGLILLLSDLFDTQDDVIKSLKNLRAKHHEIIVFHIIDPIEERFPYNDRVSLEMIEPPYQKFDLEISPDMYEQYFRIFVNKYKHLFQTAGINYQLISTNTPYEQVLNRVFKPK